MKSVLLYGYETSRETISSMKSVQVFVKSCPRNILEIRYTDTISNADLWKRFKQQPVEVDIRTRRWNWIGHTLRKVNSNITKQALEWNPQGKRKSGRPKNIWRRGLTLDLRKIGKTLEEVKNIAQYKGRWKAFAVVLCLPWDKVD